MTTEIPVLDHGFVRYVDHYGADARICEAARLSYKNPTRDAAADQKLINYLYKNKHFSPFEMVKITFNIKMPIFVMRQYIRHRMQNVNEMSARYTQLPHEFYLPTTWRIQDTKNKQGSLLANDEGLWHGKQRYHLEKVCQEAYRVYEQMLADGVAREMARMVLPVNIYTEIYATWDLRNLMGFFQLRDDAHAQAEIQDYSRAMKTITKELFPQVMEAYSRYKFVCVDQDESLGGLK